MHLLAVSQGEVTLSTSSTLHGVPCNGSAAPSFMHLFLIVVRTLL